MLYGGKKGKAIEFCSKRKAEQVTRVVCSCGKGSCSVVMLIVKLLKAAVDYAGESSGIT